MRISLCLCTGLLLAATALRAAPGKAFGPNLVPNPGFEEMVDGKAVGWALPTGEYSISTDNPRTGRNCLRFENANAEKYVLCSVPVSPEKERRYELAAWVRTENIQGKDNGATICLEFYGADKKYVGGSYPQGVKGTQPEWTRVQGVSRAVPEKATSINLTCYVRKGMTGIAYWDDVSLRQYVPPLAEGITTDLYRNETAGGPVRIKLGISLAGTKATLEDLRGRLELKDAAGAVVQTVEPSAKAIDHVEFVVDSGPLKTGDHQADCKVWLTSDPAKGEASIALHRVAKATQRRVYIDKYQRVIVEGKPFFPLGMYWSGIKPDQLATYADSAFNCLMPYGAPTKEQMDLVQKHNLKVIYSIKDFYAGSKYCPGFIKSVEDERPEIEKKVRAHRDHSALLAWYLNDELPKSMIERLASHQQWIEELDPDHPSWVVLYQVNDVRGYLSSFDAIGTDPYPIPTKPASTALDWTRKTRKAGFGHRSVWQVPQVFDWRAYKKSPEDAEKYRAPTLLEMRSMTWQCIAAGANGLIYYSWFDVRRMDKIDPFEERWAEIKTMAAEVKEFMPAILSVEEIPEVVATGSEAVAWRICRQGDALLLIAVNSDDKPAESTFRFPTALTKLAHALGQGGAQLTGRDLSVSFGPLEPKVIRLTP